MNYVKLIVDKSSKNTLYLHNGTAHHLGLFNGQQVFLRFGVREIRVQIRLSNFLTIDTSAVSQNIVNHLSLPLFPKYDLMLKGDRLLIGPYISFLATHKIKSLSAYIKRTIQDYLTQYEKTGGSILVFALEGIDVSAQTVKGYIYNPSSKEWVFGTYPYPAAIFIRGHVNSEKWCRHFQSVLGKNSVFNDFYFDKWEMHQFLMRSDSLKRFLPNTALYSKPDDVLPLLSRHGAVYLKPVHGTMGISIIKVESTGALMQISYREGNVNKFIRCRTKLKAKEALRRKLTPNNYIVQQALPLISDKGRMIDFRLIVVKNFRGQWEYMGMVARYAAKKSILSNISAGGTAEKGDEALRKVLSLTDAELNDMTERMKETAMGIANFFDASGIHCANLGVDIGIDSNRKPWIIEVQHYSPAHNIAVDANDITMYHNILKNNLLYMKRIAGFGGEETT